MWRDEAHHTGAECYRCGWVVSDKFSFCPWCRANIYEAGSSSDEPLRAPKGFKFDAKCDWGCGGGVQYPMPWCPWCGKDASGQDLIPRALTNVRRLLTASRLAPWHYRILLRPGVSGVDPRWPKRVEIEQRYVVGKRKRDEIPWSMLVGLIAHELGHSFLYHHWIWTRTESFRHAFGRVDKAYRVRDDTWVDFQRRRVTTTHPDHVTAYAATHPQEDFAETFRFYVTRRGRLRELFAELGGKRKGVIVYEKFLALHHYVRSLRGW